MPDWWGPEVEKERGALTELKLRLARRLSIDLPAWLERDDIALSVPDAVRFKRTIQVSEKAIDEPFLAYALAVAKSVAAALPDVTAAPNVEALRERATILSDRAVRWISLNALLRRCWQDLGIAVVQLRDGPNSGKGFDAATFRIDSRYVVVLAKAVAHPARAAFILAHELGHIARGDVNDGQALLDEDSDFDASNENAEEDAASEYALALLGDRTSSVQILGEANAANLLEAAYSVGESLRIDPGHIILRYGHDSKNWQTAQAALNRLKATEDASDTINNIATSQLDFSRLANDLSDLVFDALKRR